MCGTYLPGAGAPGEFSYPGRIETLFVDPAPNTVKSPCQSARSSETDLWLCPATMKQLE